MRGFMALVELVAFALAAVATDSVTATPAAENIKYFKAADVSAGFEKGMPLLEQFNYKIHASRREAPGLVEIHAKDTDIIHVLEGTATFVTGGKILDAKPTALDEVRGANVEGGTTYTLVRGDVIVVPAGTPHWFKEVKGPFLYYVVKVK